MNKKGMLFIVDSFFVLILFTFMLVFTFQSIQPYSEPSLDLFTHQLSVSLGNSQLFSDVLEQDDIGAIADFIEELPVQYCIQYTVFLEGIQIYSYTRLDCIESQSVFVSRKSFFAQEDVFETKTEVWLR